MSHRLEEKQARRAERVQAEAAAQKAERRRRRTHVTAYGAVGLIAVILVAFAVFGGSDTPSPSPSNGSASTASSDVGAKAPAFALTDVVSGKTVTTESLRGRKTMLFFSEGVSCQACLVQIADLEKAGTLEKAGIRLVSVTTDQPSDLKQVVEQYRITTPLLADPTGEMSAAYGMLGHGGMGHPQTDGHAFMLVDEAGKIAWHQAYQEMYVKPGELLADMRSAVRS